jgi:hypothetical protein
VARLVHAVHIAEGGGHDVAALLAQAKGLNDRDGVLGSAVQLLVDLADDAVLLAADDADLDLKDHLRGGRLLEQLGGDRDVLVQRHGRAVPHVGLEEGVLAAGHALGGDVEQRADERVQLVLGAVVGVQRNRDRVLLGHHPGILGEGHRARDHVLYSRAAEELGTAGRHLDDSVTLRLSEAAKGRVQRL